MKLFIFISCIFVSTMLYSVEGGLVKDFFGKVKETAETVHKDVKQIWRPESSTTIKDTGDHTVTTQATPDAAKDNTPGKKEDPKVPEISPYDNKKQSDGSSTSTSTTVATEVKEDKHEQATTESYSTTTKKEDRATFSGGCQAGFKRTENGRCMATY